MVPTRRLSPQIKYNEFTSLSCIPEVKCSATATPTNSGDSPEPSGLAGVGEDIARSSDRRDLRHGREHHDGILQLESTGISARATHAAKLVPSVLDRSSRSWMNFNRVELLAAVARNSGRVLRRAMATTCSEGASPGRMVRSQEPKDCQTSLGCVAERM